MTETSLPLFETTYWEVTLLNEQRYLGRSVVVLKRACGDLAEISPEEIEDLFSIIKQMENALRTAFGTTMFNWACNMNDAYQTLPARPQVHWHCIPRYDHAVFFAGEVFEDKNFGHHHLKGGEGDRIVSPEVHRQILQALTEALRVRTLASQVRTSAV